VQLQQEHDVFLIGARTKPNLTRLNKITVRPDGNKFLKQVKNKISFFK